MDDVPIDISSMNNLQLTLYNLIDKKTTILNTFNVKTELTYFGFYKVYNLMD